VIPITEQIPVFLRIDETQIELQHDRIVAASKRLMHHVELVHSCLDLMRAVLRHYKYEQGSDTLVVLRLLVRLLNSTNASLKLARAGYFQPAFTLVRDVLELEFLVDLFTRDRKYLTQWISLHDRDRDRKFKQVNIRTILDNLDGNTQKRRAKAYKILSKYAAHASPHAFHLISPDNFTKVGPFPSGDVISAFLHELAKHVQFASLNFYALLSPLPEEVEPEQINFASCLMHWRQLYDVNLDTEPG
jgi:hypothetical protein